ncbi:MAG: hypothetical protein A2X86_03225 [Bdellovibrionales bacterium GWA2_49_15]|nr:MAG: hypothetical protein A2X86_03225 [Bdellovibrionales bacterium GWA2_49_15]HAZ12226.1 hypothetical protein [Bdellovibrionales bacterium]
MQFRLGLCAFVGLLLGSSSFAQAPGNGSEKVVALAQAAEAVTVERRDVYNMTPAQGQLLLTWGKMRANLVPSDDPGTPQVNCPKPGAPLSSSSSSGTGSGSGSSSGSGTSISYGLDIEFRLHAVNGFDGFNGERVPYTSASFDRAVEPLVQSNRNILAGKSLEDARRWLIDHTDLDESQTTEITDALWKDRIVNAAPADRRAIYQSMGRSMSFDDQIRFISKLGGAMNSNYDDSRADQAIDANSVAQCDSILAGLASGTPTGVCRDIAICQATILYHMGNKDNVYASSYPVPGNYHVTLMVTDPNNRNRVHKISYNRVSTESNLQGSAALSHDESPDVGTMIRVWRPTERADGTIEGQFAGVLPTEIGLLLEEETSPNPRDVTGGGRFDPFTTRSYSVMHMGGHYGPASGRIFAAKLSNGDVVYGAGVSARWGSAPTGTDGVYNGIDNQGHVGLAYAHRDSTVRFVGADGTVSTEEWNLNTIYLSVHQRVGVPLRVSEHWTLTPYSDFHLEVAAINGGNADESGSWTGDGNIAVNVGGEAVYRTDDAYFRLHGHTQLTLGLTDIRGLLGSTVGVYTNYTELGVEGAYDVTPDVRLNAALLCAFREYGDTCSIGGGTTYTDGPNSHSFNLGVITPVTEAQQPWMPGGSRTSLQIGYEYQRQLNESLLLGAGINYTQSLEDQNFMVNSGLALHWY